MKKNYYILIGTIAEFIKMLPILKEFDRRNIHYKLISTGQNNIENIDLFKELKHKSVNYKINTTPKHQTSLSLFTWWIKAIILGLLIFKRIKTKNNYLIIHGDTISTLMGAILGKINGFKIVHIESGLRSFDYFSPFPEEIDRVLVSRMTDIHFAPNAWALNNLKKEKGIKINTINNTLIESLDIALKQKGRLTLKIPRKYFVIVVHRQENLMDKNFFKDVICKILEESERIHCVFIVHGNTLQTLKSMPLYKSLTNSENISLVERLPYFKFMKLLNKAEFLISDGGSNQEETSYIGLPTYIIREKTERIEGINENSILGGKKMLLLTKFMSNYKKYKKKPKRNCITPSNVIVDFLVKTT